MQEGGGHGGRLAGDRPKEEKDRQGAPGGPARGAGAGVRVERRGDEQPGERVGLARAPGSDLHTERVGAEEEGGGGGGELRAALRGGRREEEVRREAEEEQEGLVEQKRRLFFCG